MSLKDEWYAIAYENNDVKSTKKLWEKYFLLEKEIYKKILKDVNKEIVGTVENLSKEYNMDILYFIGFLDGIDDSIEKSNNIEKLKETSKVKIKIVPEKLYYNMVKAKADWLYNLDEWDGVLDKEKREEVYKKCKSEQIVKRESDKIYPNDLCPCGSGKKYKKCCGKIK